MFCNGAASFAVVLLVGFGATDGCFYGVALKYCSLLFNRLCCFVFIGWFRNYFVFGAVFKQYNWTLVYCEVLLGGGPGWCFNAETFFYRRGYGVWYSVKKESGFRLGNMARRFLSAMLRDKFFVPITIGSVWCGQVPTCPYRLVGFGPLITETTESGTA